jgi:hypothetical protein
MKKPIKQAMHEMYSNIQLSNEELNDLKALADTASSQKDVCVSTSSRMNTVVLSLCAMVFTVAVSLTWFSMTNSSMHNTLKVDAIVADAIDNHLLHNVLEYKTQSIDALAQAFSYLGFAPINSLLTESYGKLMGARPCFILGMPAAQLRYQPDDVKWSTVFQARYQEEVYGVLPSQQDPLIRSNRGVDVSMWVENDVLVVTAASQ